jgi:hypothetical protein
MRVVHPVLRRKAAAVLRDVNPQLPPGWELAVFETYRPPARQSALFRKGTSLLRRGSKHSRRPAEAVDVVFRRDGQWSWVAPTCADGRTGWDLVDASAKAHHLRRILWDKPHLELREEDR